MKFEPKYVEENVNVPEQKHGREFLKFAAWLLGIVLGIYLLLGAMVDVLAVHVPPSIEESIGSSFDSQLAENPFPQTQEYIQKILDRMVAQSSGLPPFSYKVFVMAGEDVNAFALPGGRIVMMEGLLKEIKSENALAMVLGHELGHYVNRDQLRGLGRSLIFMTMATLLGMSGDTPGFLVPSLTALNYKFSRLQEEAADTYGLSLVFVTYGHVGGVLDLYDILGKLEEKYPRLSFFSTHPLSIERRGRLEDRISLFNYFVQEPTNLQLPIEENANKKEP